MKGLTLFQSHSGIYPVTHQFSCSLFAGLLFLLLWYISVTGHLLPSLCAFSFPFRRNRTFSSLYLSGPRAFSRCVPHSSCFVGGRWTAVEVVQVVQGVCFSFFDASSAVYYCRKKRDCDYRSEPDSSCAVWEVWEVKVEQKERGRGGRHEGPHSPRSGGEMKRMGCVESSVPPSRSPLPTPPTDLPFFKGLSAGFTWESWVGSQCRR